MRRRLTRTIGACTFLLQGCGGVDDGQPQRGSTAHPSAGKGELVVRISIAEHAPPGQRAYVVSEAADRSLAVILTPALLQELRDGRSLTLRVGPGPEGASSSASVCAGAR